MSGILGRLAAAVNRALNIVEEDPEEAARYAWADEMLDLRAEWKRHADLHWRDGGPGSDEYELWLKDWSDRVNELMARRPPIRPATDWRNPR